MKLGQALKEFTAQNRYLHGPIINGRANLEILEDYKYQSYIIQ